MSALRLALVLAGVALAACAGGRPAPDWNVNARGHLQRHTQAWLTGQTRVAEREWQLARAALASTAQIDLLARAELTACALHVASLDFVPCDGFVALQADASAPEQAYARYLQGEDLSPAEQALLPPAHRQVLGSAQLPPDSQPLARLIAAGVLLRRSQASPATLDQAVDTASAQGWSRPLLAWLGAQQRLAQERGDAAEAARIGRRMQVLAPAQP